MLHSLQSFVLGVLGLLLFAHTLASALFFVTVYGDEEVRVEDRVFWRVLLVYTGGAALTTMTIFVYVAVHL